jgi:hypothetical protein
MHLLRTKPLVTELAAQAVGAEEQAQYLLASLLIWVAAGYLGLAFTSGPLWSIPCIAEGVVTALIHMIGITKCLDAAGARKSTNFLIDFSCLYAPVAITSLLLVWGVYWAIWLGFEETLTTLSQSNLGLAINLSRIGTDFGGFLLFLANVGTQLLIYYRLRRLLSEVRDARHLAPST